MISISESRLLSFLSGERFHRLHIEIVVQVQEVQIFPVDEEHQHVEPLPADLETDLEPVHFGELEELGACKGLQETPLLLSLGLLLMECIQHPGFQHLLVADTHLHGVASGAAFSVPVGDEGHIVGSLHLPTAEVEGLVGPEQTDPVGGLPVPEVLLGQEGFEVFPEIDLLEFLLGNVLNLGEVSDLLINFMGCYWVNRRIESESWNLWILLFYIHCCWIMICSDCHLSRPIVVKIRESYLVFCSDWVSDNNLIYVIELIPVFIIVLQISVQRLKFWATRNCQIQRFCCEERF